jgi:phosphatidylglycerophosphate synthase
MTQQRMEVQPAVSGKASTALQLAAVAVTLVGLIDATLVPQTVRDVVYYATGAVTAAAGLQYMYRGLAWLSRLGEVPAAGRRDEEPGRRRA